MNTWKRDLEKEIEATGRWRQQPKIEPLIEKSGTMFIRLGPDYTST